MTVNVNDAPVESWDVDALVPYALNHKKHPEKQIDLLARLIGAKGLLNPILVRENGEIIAGHGRRLAILKLGWKKVPVRVLRNLSDAEASELRIADNKTVSNEYDTDILGSELAALAGEGADLTMLGFDQRELDMLIGDVGEMDLDSVVADLDETVTRHEAEIEERAEAADEEEVRLDKAFGFKTIPLRDQKTVTRFMAEVENLAQVEGPQALIGHMRSWLAGLDL